MTVDEAAATGPAEPLAGSATPATEPVLQSAAEAPRPDHAGDHAAAHPDEAVEEEDEGWSLPARVLTALVLVLVGVALGIWAAPKIAPVLPSGMKPVADWLTPGASSAEAEIAALRAELDQGLSGVESRFAALPAPEAADQRIAAAVGSAKGELSGEIAALKRTVGQIDPTAARQQLDRLDAAVKGQEAELAALKEQLAGATAASGQRSDEAVDNLNVYSAEVEGLRAEMGTLQDKVSALATRIDQVAADADRQIATAQTRVGEIQTRAASALGAAETGAAVA
ncbi:MAG TPA: hypothetical protein VFN28_01730, partial [Amaricoccus sp.]|nr:hypothetical protein [Amaricoccus sp.]